MSNVKEFKIPTNKGLWISERLFQEKIEKLFVIDRLLLGPKRDRTKSEVKMLLRAKRG